MTPQSGARALNLACYLQNEICDLEEIIELFCLDAEAAQPVQPVSNEEIDAAVFAERVACAILCDARHMGDNTREDMEARRCAAMIRARSQTESIVHKEAI